MNRKAYILGAGVTGLSAGWRLAESGFRVVVAEKENWIGGQAATFQRGDYRFDLGPHKLFTVMDDVMDTIRELLGSDLLKVPKVGKIYFNGRFVNFPVGPKDIMKVLSPGEMAVCFGSFLAAWVKGRLRGRATSNYEEWVVSHFGRALYQKVVQPCTEKIWGESGTLGVELAQTRIRVQSLAELAKEFIFRIKPQRVVNAPHFFYPRNGIGMLPEAIARRLVELGGEIRKGVVPARVIVRDGAVRGIDWSDGMAETLDEWDVVVSTIPKRDLLDVMTSAPGEEIQEALESLRERSLILLFLLLKKESMSDYSWIFFPEKECIFNRVFEQNKCSPSMVPPGKTLVCAEITCKREDPMWRAQKAHIFDLAVKNLESVGLIGRDEVLDHFEVRLPHAYPIWDIYSRRNVETVLDYIEGFENLYSVGRQGGFIYGGTADSMDMGFRTARHIVARETKEMWRANRSQFHSYVVID